MATTVGETAADYLAVDVKLGLTNTTYVMGIGLVAVLIAQFRTRKYVPGIYWLAVVMISIVGTLITDNLVDNLGVSLWTCTIGFGVALIVTFTVWCRREGTLSIHEADSTPREAWYWLAILCTFALGTAAGDLLAEGINLGYATSALLFAGVIALMYLAHKSLGLGPVVGFWMAYVLTRPLGASIGDFLSQDTVDGGLGLGTTTTSFLFLAAILATVTYLSITQADRIERTGERRYDGERIIR